MHIQDRPIGKSFTQEKHNLSKTSVKHKLNAHGEVMFTDSAMLHINMAALPIPFTAVLPTQLILITSPCLNVTFNFFRKHAGPTFNFAFSVPSLMIQLCLILLSS